VRRKPHRLPKQQGAPGEGQFSAALQAEGDVLVASSIDLAARQALDEIDRGSDVPL
jgi:hypothetical protein